MLHLTKLQQTIIYKMTDASENARTCVIMNLMTCTQNMFRVSMVLGILYLTNPGDVNRQAASDLPLERLKRLEKRLKCHRHGLRKADGAR